MPEVEVEVDEQVVRSLLQHQYASIDPVAASEPITFLAQGWDNAIFRLGRARIVRLPIRSQAAPLINHEARWLPTIAELVPVAVPVPIFVGTAQGEYPWSWLVGPWIDGDRVTTLPSSERINWAQTWRQH